MNRLEEIGNKYTILCSLKEKQNIDWDDDREIYIQKIEAAVQIANTGALAKPTKITATRKTGEKYERITGYELGPIPEEVPQIQDFSTSSSTCNDCLYFADGWCNVTYQSNLTPDSPSCGQFLDKDEIPF